MRKERKVVAQRKSASRSMGQSPSVSRTHDLKTWPEHFRALASGEKTFEVRRNDRDFRVGDMLRLREYGPVSKMYTGAELTFEVSHLLQDERFGIARDFCVLSLRRAADPVRGELVEALGRFVSYFDRLNGMSVDQLLYGDGTDEKTLVENGRAALTKAEGLSSGPPSAESASTSNIESTKERA